VDLLLWVGEISQEVVVTGEAPLLNMTRAETAGLINSRDPRPADQRARFHRAGRAAGRRNLMRNANDRDTSKGYGNKMAFAGARPHRRRC
jgi:hypothetical protein